MFCTVKLSIVADVELFCQTPTRICSPSIIDVETCRLKSAFQPPERVILRSMRTTSAPVPV